MTAIEEMAGMDVLCSDKTGTLTLNKLSVDKNLIEVILNTWSLHLEKICIKSDRTWAIDFCTVPVALVCKKITIQFFY